MGKLRDWVMLVGLGGATCSGKSTLAKHLAAVLPNSIIIHQDDFAPPEELVPIHPVHKVPDWDTPQWAIDWPRMKGFLKNVKETGAIPPDHTSQDYHHSGEPNTTVTDSTYRDLATRFRRVEDEQRKKGIRIIWGLVDGFLMYWDKEIAERLDVRFFLRVPHDTLKERRDKRNEFYASGHSPWGTLWIDPPGYWENIAYPTYVEAHRDVFENGDVEHGKLTMEGLILIESENEGGKMTMDDIVQACCDVLLNSLSRK